MVETSHIVDWLSRLVQIPSVTPAHAAGQEDIAGEARLAAQVETWFRSFGAEVQREEVFPKRPNVYGLWRGQSDTWLAVDVHMDTVGVAQMEGDPFDGRVEDGRVYGRGAVDTKASLAVLLAMLEQQHERGLPLPFNLLVAATACEENGTQGAPVFAKWARRQDFRISQLIVAEPTLCGPLYGHKGVMNLEYEIQGRAAHTAMPEQGQNAIAAAAHLIVALEAEHKALQAGTPSTELGNGVLTVSLVNGGVGINIVPDNCKVTLNRRVVPGESEQALRDRFQALAEVHCPLPYTMKVLHFLPPFYQPPDSAFAQQLAEWSGCEPAVAPFATNAWAYDGLAQECVVIGPGSIDQAHGAEEWVAIAELDKLAQIYTRWWGI